MMKTKMTTDMIIQLYSAIIITTIIIEVLLYQGMDITIMYPHIDRHKMDRLNYHCCSNSNFEENKGIYCGK